MHAGIRGRFHGSFRNLCRPQTSSRHALRTHPKTMPFTGTPAAQLTEASVRITTFALVCGQTYGSFENHAVYRHCRGTVHGSIRKNCHFPPHLRSNIRKHPRKLPRAGCFAARLTETSANCATAGERSAQKAAQCRRTQKVGHAYACPTLTDAKLTASCADAPHAAH